MKTPHLLGTIALLLCGFGVLISVEVIRPFRDMAIDGPIALGSWGAGLALGITCFFLKGRSLTLSIISAAAPPSPAGCLGNALGDIEQQFRLALARTDAA